ncbi:PREDICTED: probable G-protein coupled receptor 149 [Cyprinodon variegatus]|uniref:probable G-protein coupled receptor 149 n=1 Tax=Cyprinodon variegatus TaxID=28743 RepID=UPI000742CCF0|nr:PREDICTED: probable G-protein coupled receptor 149 [Cyprinodon variegatus]
MSTTHESSPAPNQSHLFTPSSDTADRSGMETRIKLLLFGLCVTIAAATLVGGVYSLLSLLRMRRKTSLCVIVASMSVDDLLSVIPLSLFMLLQWETRWGEGSGSLCTLSGLLYVFQGVSSNMKACLIAAYTFYVTKRFGVLQSSRRPLRVLWAIGGVWAVSLAVSMLPLCGWGSFTPASLGCFPESDSFYTVLLFSLYLMCFCGFLVFFIPLTYQLLCSREPQRTLLYSSYLDMARGLSGSAALCELPSFSRDSMDRSFSAYNEMSPSSSGTGVRQKEDGRLSPVSGSGRGEEASVGDTPVVFAQKRFSMILAVLRVILWMPMMTLVLIRHAADARSSSLETLSFFLTLLAPAITPLFVLSERWIHMPCGCFINCQRDLKQEPSGMKRKLQFSLSLQQGYGVYKLSHATKSLSSPPVEKPSYHSLFNCDFPNTHLCALEPGGLSRLNPSFDFSTPLPVDSSSHARLFLEATASVVGAVADHPVLPHENHKDEEFHCVPSLSSHLREKDHTLNDSSSVFDGPERRLSHEECRKIELTDWEWCRSKSERTPRQRSSGGLSIPLCAFQGTVSLQAPTGKTLSLSTYEVSSDGLKISPNNAKKVEVYRSKSVGHEPSADDPGSGGHTGEANVSCVGMEIGMGMGIGAGVGDTNVKIHLEVLEICDNEEAMDSVSIVSNISQSSTHARSPSLRYSRRENRFVSCDLGETASYSLLIPSGGNTEAETINITIPDTVEAHRQNSRRQTHESSGYHEDIQLLNEAYRKQAGEGEE